MSLEAYILEQLSDLYEPEDAREWLHSYQELLQGVPAKLIRQGRTDEVLMAIEQLRDGAFG